MYKVFFKDRTVYFGDDFSRIFEKHNGLFYKYNNFQELTELVRVFNGLKKIDKLFIFHTDILTLFEEFKQCFNYIEAGGGVVMNPAGQFIIMKRKGLWDLPKGKKKDKEQIEDTAIREVREETGLDELSIVRPILSTFHTYEVADKIFLKKTKWFEMLYKGNKEPVPQTDEDITELRWVEPGMTDFIRSNTYPSILDALYIRDLL